MKLRTIVATLGAAAILAACSGGGTSNNTPATQQTLQTVTGSLPLAYANSTSSTARKPAYVSTGTTAARIYIDSSTTAANSVTTCNSSLPTNGTGTACTLTWAAQLSVPAAHTFHVETDNGAAILSTGQGSYSIVSGNNTLSPALSLNGVVAQASFTVASCTAGNPGTCSGTLFLSDASGHAIINGAGNPTQGTTPTNGTVYDNDGGGSDDVTLTSSAPSFGTVSGTAESNYSTFASNTLTILGPEVNGDFTYQVSCVTGASGSFGITVGGGNGASKGLTAGQVTAVGGLTYATSVTTTATAPSFTCATGVITDTNGTLPVN